MDVKSVELINSFSTDMGLCKNCNAPVITTPFKRGLVHSSDMMKGCRAASFVEGKGWDNSLPRSWNAKLSREKKKCNATS